MKIFDTIVILGAESPEMDMVENLLHHVGIPVAYAQTATGGRVCAGEEAADYSGLSLSPTYTAETITIVMVECSVPRSVFTPTWMRNLSIVHWTMEEGRRSRYGA